MHWFNYAWIVPIAIALLVWGFFSIRNVILTIREYIKNPENDILTYMADYLEENTKGFFALIVVVLTAASFVSFVWNCIPE